MVRIVAALVLGLVQASLAQVALSQDSAAQEADAMSEAMTRNPARFEARMVDLVAGFGGPDGLTPVGIEEHVALERAAARAAAIRRFLAMDLDADGAVGGEELATAQRAASAATRGRMERQFAAADSNDDGTASAAEIAAAGRAAGLSALTEEEAELLRSLMRLDADQSGAVSTEEVSTATARAAAAGD